MVSWSNYSGEGERGRMLPYEGERARDGSENVSHSKKVVSKVAAAIASVSALHDHARKTVERRSPYISRCESVPCDGQDAQLPPHIYHWKVEDVHHEWGAEHRARKMLFNQQRKGACLDRRAAADIKLEEDEEGSSALYPGIHGRSLGRVLSFQESYCNMFSSLQSWKK